MKKGKIKSKETEEKQSKRLSTHNYPCTTNIICNNKKVKKI